MNITLLLRLSHATPSSIYSDLHGRSPTQAVTVALNEAIEVKMA
jgi:hypothetical protein